MNPIFEKRNFYAISFSSSNIKEISDIRNYFNKYNLRKAQNLIEPSDNFEFNHYYYCTNKLFTNPINLDKENIEIKNGKTTYKYNFFVFQVKIKNKKINFIAVPFYSMAIHVFKEFKERTRGFGIYYKKILLEKLLEAVSKNRHLGGAIAIKRVRYQVYGELKTDIINLIGTDIPHSPIVKFIEDPLKRMGAKIIPDRLRITFSNEEGRFTLDSDTFGNYKLRIGAAARNLRFIKNIMTYLFNENLLDESTGFPYMKALEE